MVDPDQQDGHVGRAPRRVTVAQLDQSIQVAVGRPWAGLGAVAASLGRADYAMVVSESTDPNLVFAKFLEDGAREVCLATAAADLAAPTAEGRVLARKLGEGSLTKIADLPRAAIAQNLVYLSTRFWGAPLAGEDLDAWTALFEQLAIRAQSAGKPEQAFAAVCLALMTDPRFITL
jgi:hypothetical protein